MWLYGFALAISFTMIGSTLSSDLGPRFDDGSRLSLARIVQDEIAFVENDVDWDENDAKEDTRENIFSLPKCDEEEERFVSGNRVCLVQTPQILTNNNNNNKLPSNIKFRSTGTTIAGVHCRLVSNETDSNSSCVVLGADTRATDGSMVADKDCNKIHCLVPSCVYACGAGTAGDLEALARQVRYSFKLQSLHDNSIGNDDNDNDDVLVRLSGACRMVRDALYESGGGNLGVNLIVGGMVRDGVALAAIHPHGSMDEGIPYAALGSGGLAAMSVLESRHRPDMTLSQAKELVTQAILAGMQNDLGSGGRTLRLCVLVVDNHHHQNSVQEEIVDVSALTKAGPETFDTSSTMDTTTTTTTHNATAGVRTGVNGFGNLPYREQSRRVTMAFVDKSSLRNEWNKRLGLDKESS